MPVLRSTIHQGRTTRRKPFKIQYEQAMPLSQDFYMRIFVHTTLQVIQMDRLTVASALGVAMEVAHQVQATPPWLCKFKL